MKRVLDRRLSKRKKTKVNEYILSCHFNVRILWLTILNFLWLALNSLNVCGPFMIVALFSHQQMQNPLFLVALPLLCLFATVNAVSGRNIIAEGNVHFPWLAAIHIKPQPHLYARHCAGVLIHARMVLTAARLSRH